MVGLDTIVILVLMGSFARSMSCNQDLSVNDGLNSEYPIVQLKAVCSETTVTVTYEAEDKEQFVSEFGIIEGVDYTCRNFTDAIVGEGLVFGNRPQQSMSTAEINSVNFPVGTECTFLGCYEYQLSFPKAEYSFQEISCTILGRLSANASA